MTSAYGFGLATLTQDGTVLDVWYPHVKLIDATDNLTPGTSDMPIATMAAAGFPQLENLIGKDDLRGTTRTLVQTYLPDLEQAPQDTYDAYLRLHLLSHRLVKPHGQNLDGIFGLLTNVVWTNFGPCSTENFELTRAALQQRGPITVYSVDKFPRMVDYYIPSGVRIGDADRIRLGAYLANGTTVMHEGFVNFNAGTLGSSMVEGRISAGVTVGDDSDIGGGASIMGTLSGGGKEVIKIGQRSLLGANSGVGISIGNDCVVEAGLYVTAGTKVTVQGKLAEALDLTPGKTVKAKELSGKNNILFRRNSVNGSVEVVSRATDSVSLNQELHKN